MVKNRTAYSILLVCSIAAIAAWFFDKYPNSMPKFFYAYVRFATAVTLNDKWSASDSALTASHVYYSFAWIMVILFFKLVWDWAPTQEGKRGGLYFTSPDRLTPWKRIGLVLMSLICIPFLILFWMAFVGNDSRLFLIRSSKVALYVWGWIPSCFIALSTYAIIAGIKKSITKHL